MTTVMADPVGVVELAARLGVAPRTVRMWRERSVGARVPMPQPDYAEVNGSPAWEWPSILRWAGLTGHLAYGPAIDEYVHRFGEDPIEPRRGGRMAAEVADAALAVQAPKKRRKR